VEVDVFALGVSLFIMRAKNPPFTEASVDNNLYRMLLEGDERYWMAFG
jgi:hypothetical protein